ncbi:MAG: hypothetical protein ACUVQP_12680 [Bacteroidales bacterium]
MSEQNYKIRIKIGDVEIEAQGDKEFVEKHIEEFKKEMPKIAKELPPKEKPIPPEIPREEVELEKLSLGEFYKRKQPKDHNETVVVFAYWLTKKEGKAEFKGGDINTCYDEARISKPKNVRQHIKGMTSGKKAYLTAVARRGYYKLTLTGEEFVEKELPRKSEE